MLLPRTSQYAIAGVLRLAALPPDEFYRVEDLVRGTDAPRHAVAKVFHELAKRGLLDSIRGSGGGYRLAPGVLDRTLMDVVEAVNGPWEGKAIGVRGLCLPQSPCPLAALLQPVSEHIEQLLKSTRIRDLLKHVPPYTSARWLAGEAGEPAVVPGEHHQ